MREYGGNVASALERNAKGDIGQEDRVGDKRDDGYGQLW